MTKASEHLYMYVFATLLPSWVQCLSQIFCYSCTQFLPAVGVHQFYLLEPEFFLHFCLLGQLPIEEIIKRITNKKQIFKLSHTIQICIK